MEHNIFLSHRLFNRPYKRNLVLHDDCVKRFPNQLFQQTFQILPFRGNLYLEQFPHAADIVRIQRRKPLFSRYGLKTSVPVCFLCFFGFTVLRSKDRKIEIVILFIVQKQIIHKRFHCPATYWWQRKKRGQDKSNLFHWPPPLSFHLDWSMSKYPSL